MPFHFPGDDTSPCLIIAEVGQNHDGSLGTAHSYIKAAAAAGVDAIKFQTHIAAAESTPGEPWRVKFSYQDATRYDYWKRMEFTEDQWNGLASHAADCGIGFLTSVFSTEALEMMLRVGVPAWKAGAGEITNLPLLTQMARTRLPVILSSGMSSWQELDDAVRAVRSAGAPVAVLQCTTAYPCPPERIGLNVMAELRRRYGCPTGLSDHSGTVFAGLAAAALGAKILEVHVTLSRECFGPDVVASLTTAELKELVAGVRFIETAMANPVDKDATAQQMIDLRTAFTKSVVAAHDLTAGMRVGSSDLALKKPGSGMPASRLPDILNRKLARAVAANTILSEADFEIEA